MENENEKNPNKIIEVVGTLFFKEGKILLCKPRKRPTYQLIGGRVEKGETILEAAIRECHEELGDKAVFNENNIEFVMDFIETASSDPNLKIHMHIFKYNGILEGDLTTSEEIANFVWYNLESEEIPLSFTIKNEVIPYALKNKLIY